MPKKMTTRQFVERARKVHGDKYDYSDAEYVSAHTKVTVICSVHGAFEQRPSDHIHRLSGCPSCAVSGNAKSRTLTTEEFVERAQKVHGSRYDYSKVEYVSAHAKVTVICSVHGAFEQAAHSHLGGKGCQACHIGELQTSKRYDKELFVTKARETHGDRYDYSKVEYRGSKRAVTIVCPDHGDFEQVPSSHLAGRGCRRCYVERVSTNVFAANSSVVHGGKYDYTRSVYTASKDEVIIVCPNHGEFRQVAGEHVRGSGCPLCATYGFDKSKPGYVYCIANEEQTMMKIGVTNNFNQRMNQLRSGTPFNIVVMAVARMTGYRAARTEKKFHAQLRNAGLRGFDGATEWFVFDKAKIEELKNGD